MRRLTPSITALRPICWRLTELPSPSNSAAFTLSGGAGCAILTLEPVGCSEQRLARPYLLFESIREPSELHHDEPHILRAAAHLDAFPVFPFRGPHGEQEIAASLVFILASITDGVDGYLARKRGQITTMGMLLDPLADKLMITAAFICLVQFNPTS